MRVSPLRPLGFGRDDTVWRRGHPANPHLFEMWCTRVGVFGLRSRSGLLSMPLRSYEMILRMWRVFVVMCCLLLVRSVVRAQDEPLTAEERGMFRRYAVSGVFEGRPVPPLLRSHDALMFRTRLRQAAAGGVNFAGKYELALWGCGTGCVEGAIVSARDGQVMFLPFITTWNREVSSGIRYRRNSRAIHFVGSRGEDGPSLDMWYEGRARSFA